MKNYIIISLLFLLLGCSQNEYHTDDLIKMDNGLYTEKFSGEPISGKVYDYFGEKGNLKKVYLGNLLKGKEEGKWTTWYENGVKKTEGTLKNGIRDGLITGWYENGQKMVEGNTKDGKDYGLMTTWYKNGKKRSEGTFKDGELISLKEWNEDGSVKK